jgi:hypothetical protein
MPARLDRAQATAALTRRLRPRRPGLLDIVSELHHFALITYAVPRERLAPLVPDRFEIVELTIGGEPRALVSAVPFVDVDFRFVRMPWLRLRFAQTNHRVYVRDRDSGEHAVWFFGTTLGSRWVHAARLLWSIPWHRARYRVDCDYDPVTARYRRFRYDIDCGWCAARIDLDDTGQPPPVVDGFETVEEMTLVLTHPVDGYFRRRDGVLGTYAVSHAVIAFHLARPRDLYFSLYERLGLLSPDEMQRPLSALIARRTEFHIHMPPRRLTP